LQDALEDAVAFCKRQEHLGPFAAADIVLVQPVS
jgi:hypothetical protein